MKLDKWIEKDKKLLERPRECRIVTYLDLEDPEFVKKYPEAEIGSQIFDPKPLFWKVGLKRKPTMEEQYARMAAQFRRELEAEMELGQEEDLYDDEFEDSPLLSTYEAVGALYDAIPEQLDIETYIAASKEPATTPAEGPAPAPPVQKTGQ